MDLRNQAELCFLILIAGLSIVTGEDVLVHNLRQKSTKCYLPRRIDVTILRDNENDVRLTLKANDIIKFPSHVIKMSSDDVTGDLKHQAVQIHQQSRAYHNTERIASFVVKCVTDADTEVPYILLDGTFFENDTKYLLTANPEDVRIGPIDVTIGYTMQEVVEFNNPLDHQYIPMVEPNTRLPKYEEENIAQQLNRNKRATTTTTDYYIDVLPVIDYHLYEQWLYKTNNNTTAAETSIITYFTNVFTSMYIRLQTLPLPGKLLHLTMINPVIQTTPESSPFSETNKEALSSGGFKINVVTLLNSFKNWVGNSTTLAPHDHAMLFTGYNIYGGTDGEVGNNLTRGLAYVGSICTTDGSSSSVVQDQLAYQSEPVAIHELGHSLGSKHDGEGNACSSSDRYIMAKGAYEYTDANKLNPFHFSTCSGQDIGTTLSQVESSSLAQCLTTKLGTQYTVVNPLAVADQCQALYGPLSFACRGGSIPPPTDICHAMFCSISNDGVCRQMTAATGTCCANGKYCKEGSCVPVVNSTDCVLDEECPLEDQPGVVAQGKTCDQLGPAYCYLPDFYSHCCHMCQSHRTNVTGCDYGDKVLGCNAADCGSTTVSEVKYDFYCCETCAGYTTIPCQDATAFMFQGTLHNCSRLISYGKHMCYFQEVHQKICCQTCSSVRSTVSQDCPFGDRLHKLNCNNLWGLGRLCTTEEAGYCCETCPKLQTPATSQTDQPSGETTQSSGTGTTNNGTQGCTGDSCGGAIVITISSSIISLSAIVFMFSFLFVYA